MRMLTSLVALALTVAVTAPAAALNITYTAFDHAPFNVLPLSTAHLSLTVDSAFNKFGGHDVTGISGDVDGDVITGLLPLNGPAQCTCFPDGYDYGNGIFALSQSVYDNGPVTDHGGIGFQSATTAYDFYNPSGTGVYELDAVSINATIGGLIAGTDPFSASVGGVPEPASWALLIAGFGLTGAVMRRRAPFATVTA